MMVSFIDEQRETHGVESICRRLPIAPSTYYEQGARQCLWSNRSAARCRAVRIGRRIRKPDVPASAIVTRMGRDRLRALFAVGE